ncbi:MAG: hypothetical protein WAO98_03015 [Alphaproteobacteria bacterium]
MTVAIMESRAIELLSQFCNPKFYPREEDMLNMLTHEAGPEVLGGLRAFLGKIIDNDAMSASQKVKKYFNLSITDEEKAETFIDEIYCMISEHLYADEE